MFVAHAFHRLPSEILALPEFEIELMVAFLVMIYEDQKRA